MTHLLLTYAHEDRSIVQDSSPVKLCIVCDIYVRHSDDKNVCMYVCVSVFMSRSARVRAFSSTE